MQGWKTQLRPWICAGLSGAAVGILLLGFATGFDWFYLNWEELGKLALVLVVPCIGNSLLGVCVTKRQARRGILMVPAAFFVVPIFFAAQTGRFWDILLLVPAIVVWSSGLAGISVAAQCDDTSDRSSDTEPPTASK